MLPRRDGRLSDARTSRSRDRAPRPRAGDGGRALCQGRGSPRRSALAAAEGFRAAARRPDRDRPRPAGQISARRSYRPATCCSCISACRARFMFFAKPAARRSAATITSARSTSAHDHVVFHMSSGATVTFNDPRRFGSMKLVRARQARCRAAAQGSRPRAARQRLRRRHAGARLQRQEDEPEGGAVGPAHRRRARQHLCLRGAVSRAAVAQAHGLDDRHARPARPTSAPNAWSRPSRRCSTTPSRPAARRCAITSCTDGELGMFQHHFRVYDREGEKCPTPGCGGTVKRIVQNGRSTFYCPVCQKVTPGKAVPGAIDEPRQRHELPDHHRRDARQSRPDPAQSPAGAQRAQQRADAAS